MSDDDVIRIEGVEYELCEADGLDRIIEGHNIRIRPKRKQTGWKCVGPLGENDPCGEPCYSMSRIRPASCCHNHLNDDIFEPGTWQPFYGKVVE